MSFGCYPDLNHAFFSISFLDHPTPPFQSGSIWFKTFCFLAQLAELLQIICLLYFRGGSISRKLMES